MKVRTEKTIRFSGKEIAENPTKVLKCIFGEFEIRADIIPAAGKDGPEYNVKKVESGEIN